MLIIVQLRLFKVKADIWPSLIEFILKQIPSENSLHFQFRDVFKTHWIDVLKWEIICSDIQIKQNMQIKSIHKSSLQFKPDYFLKIIV